MTTPDERKGEIHRRTKETDIKLCLTADGSGKASINTGIPFMDHMLTLFAVHGFFDLSIDAAGDTEVDGHHTVEDLGICLGQAFKSALDDFKGLRRYGSSTIPMDETLVRITADFSNRPYLHYGVKPRDQKVGNFDTALVKEFLRALTVHAGLTLHVEMIRGDNSHHILEAVFKALGKCLDQAATREPRITGALSSKGAL